MGREKKKRSNSRVCLTTRGEAAKGSVRHNVGGGGVGFLPGQNSLLHISLSKRIVEGAGCQKSSLSLHSGGGRRRC